MEIALSLFFGALVGFSLGALGAGGSILVLPALIYGLGIDPKQAVVLALAIVGATSLYGSAIHARQGHVRPTAALLFSITGFGGAFLGAKASEHVEGEIILLGLTGVMLLAGVRMYRSASSTKQDPEPNQGAGWLEKSAPLLLAGVAVGFLTGFLGVGGGFLIVPALTLVGRLPVKHAIGTSLVVITINCLSGLIAHRFEGLDAVIIFPFIVGSFAASTVAARIASKLSAKTLKRSFAAFILVLGLFMLGDAALKLGREQPETPADETETPAEQGETP